MRDYDEPSRKTEEIEQKERDGLLAVQSLRSRKCMRLSIKNLTGSPGQSADQERMEAQLKFGIIPR